MVQITRTIFWPNDIEKEVLQSRQNKQASSDLLVTWSRSTSASSIYRLVHKFLFLSFKWEIPNICQIYKIEHSRNVEQTPKQQMISTIGWAEPITLRAWNLTTHFVDSNRWCILIRREEAILNVANTFEHSS